jgi:hypothetical protein
MVQLVDDYRLGVGYDAVNVYTYPFQCQILPVVKDKAAPLTGAGCSLIEGSFSGAVIHSSTWEGFFLPGLPGAKKEARSRTV